MQALANAPARRALLSAPRGGRIRMQAFASASAAAPATKTSGLSAEAKKRAKAAVLGGLVADAATMPLHWIYDVPKMNELLKAEGRSAASPEWYPTPSCPFYQHKFGEQSPYGAELVPLLRTIANNGELNAEAYSQAVYEYFTTGTAYRNASIRQVIEKYEAGKRGVECGHDKDFQANCFAKAAILVAKYGGTPELMVKAEEAIRVQQNNDDAVKYGLAGVKLLEKVVVEGQSLDQALNWAVGAGGLEADLQALVQRALGTRQQHLRELQFEVADYMKEMMNKHVELKDELPPFTFSVWCNGPACGNPAAFTNVAMTAAHFSSYVEGVRANLMAGGDNCSRSCLIGALLAAQLALTTGALPVALARLQEGLDAIPKDWRDKTAMYPEFEALVDKILA